MNKIITVTALAATIFSVSAFAQNSSDAFRLSNNNYYGTARSIGLGNAVTALGGDLGSIGLNPAGSAVNNFTQFTITPGISIITSGSQYNGNPSANGAYDPAIKNSKTNFIMPNFGAVLNFDTKRNGGLKNITFGFVGNASNYYMDNMVAGGSTDKTSFLGELAAYASDKGLDAAILDKADYINSVYPYTWDAIVGYKSGMIATFGGSNTQYVGTTEKIYSGNKIETAGMLDQRYGRDRSGSKYDMSFNIGFNFSDMFYIGANLGIITISSDFASYYKEAADLNNPNFDIEFEQNGGPVKVRFSDFRFRQTIRMNGSGAYGKFGFIFVPVQGLRFGGAIQTPTSTFIRETYQCAGDTHFSNSNFDSQAKSTEGTYEYRLISPFRLNLGAAYTFSRGLISADYEMSDYSLMKFKESDYNYSDNFADVNNAIKDSYGISHMLRLGGEFKVTPEFALRAGYNLYTPAERYMEDGVKKVPKAYSHSFAAGFGYSSKGSFFCDLTGRYMIKANEYFYPYGNYIKDTASPEVLVKSHLVDIVMTLGWRF